MKDTSDPSAEDMMMPTHLTSIATVVVQADDMTVPTTTITKMTTNSIPTTTIQEIIMKTQNVDGT
jgi:hypothetical protein